MWGLCGFMWIGCFAWLVGLLYACVVRRIKGLRRVCLNFIRFSSSLPSFSSLHLLFVLRLVCFVMVVFCLSSCLVLFVLVSLWSLLLFLFPLRMNRQKERAQRFCPCVLSCPVVGCVSLVPCALLRVFGYSRRGMPLYLP